MIDCEWLVISLGRVLIAFVIDSAILLLSAFAHLLCLLLTSSEAPKKRSLASFWLGPGVCSVSHAAKHKWSPEKGGAETWSKFGDDKEMAK